MKQTTFPRLALLLERNRYSGIKITATTGAILILSLTMIAASLSPLM